MVYGRVCILYFVQALSTKLPHLEDMLVKQWEEVKERAKMEKARVRMANPDRSRAKEARALVKVQKGDAMSAVAPIW